MTIVEIVMKNNDLVDNKIMPDKIRNQTCTQLQFKKLMLIQI